MMQEKQKALDTMLRYSRVKVSRFGGFFINYDLLLSVHQGCLNPVVQLP